MQLVKIIATNFLSFKELSYDFENHPILIQGENLTDIEGQESNGSGKTSLQSAVEFALLKVTVKETESDLIFWGEEEATVQLSIYCPIRKETLVIDRVISLKSSSQLKLKIISDDGQTTNVSFATVIDGNKLILNWIGITREDLQNYYIINKERYKSFFSSTNKEKIEMINRFSNAKIIDGIDKEIQVDVDTLEGELELFKTNQTSIISKIQTLKEQVDIELGRDLVAENIIEEQRLNSIIDEHTEKIDELKESIDGKDILIEAAKQSEPINKKSIDDLTSQIEGKARQISEVEKSLVKLNEFSQTDKYLVLDEKLSQINSVKTETTIKKKGAVASKQEIFDILDDINKNIKGAVKCPKCSHEFLVGDPDVDIEAEKESKLETEELLKQVEDSIVNIVSELSKLEDQTSKIESEKIILKKEDDRIYNEKKKIKDSVENLRDEISEIKKEITSVESTIQASKLKVERYDKEKENLKLEIQDEEKKIKDIKLQIIGLKDRQIDHERIANLKLQMRGEGSKLRDINYSIRRKKDQIFNTSQWIFNFKKFNLHLANSSLKIIQGYCNKFLQELKSDIQIRWEGKKILANGDLKEEISAYIIRNSETKKFWSFSGGERVRLEYAMILTLQRMINSTNKYGGLDILMLDEIGEGIDSLGLQCLMKALSEFEKTILITTHVVNRNIGDRILLVRKENGISKIINN